MTKQRTSTRGHWIAIVILFLLLIACIGERLYHGFVAKFELEAAVLYSSDIASRMTAHWHENGSWPPEGEVMNRGFVFVSSTTDANSNRIDLYTGIGGQIQVGLMPNGTIRVDHVDP